jgi:nucleoside-diphosphate-sugar epimerase
MSRVILAGSTGDLGFRVLRNLHELGGNVTCIVRKNVQPEVIEKLRPYADKIVETDYEDIGSLTKACEGGSVVVSTVSGLRPVIIDFQTRLLKAAVSAGVPRFIPSDYAIDYRPIPKGENRNLNLREEFRKILDAEKNIKATSILNGAFMDMLTGVAPFILFPIRRILCWGNPNQLMDWTSIEDTARFTAYAALDESTPRYLSIAGDELSANKLSEIMTELKGKKFGVLRPGGLAFFRFMIKITKLTTPDRGKIYPPWQGMQYMYSIYKGDCKFRKLDNDRYPIAFTSAKNLLGDFLSNKILKNEPHDH